MTYCVAAAVKEGIVFVSDSRTNAGIDRVSVYPKTYRWAFPGDRVITLMAAGSLATTQMVVKQIEKDLADSVPGELGTPVSLRTIESMHGVAEYVGRLNSQKQALQGKVASGVQLGCTFIVGGQVKGEVPELYLVYPEGNFIAYSTAQPFLQSGETKYGKPILDRIISADTSLEEATRCLLVSMASTLRSNASVGYPIDVTIYRTDSLKIDETLSFDEDDPFFTELSRSWAEGLSQAFSLLPRFEWEPRQNTAVSTGSTAQLGTNSQVQHGCGLQQQSQQPDASTLLQPGESQCAALPAAGPQVQQSQSASSVVKVGGYGNGIYDPATTATK